MTAFLDANVPMYAAGRAHSAKGPCLDLLRRVATGEVDAATDVEVLQEILHRFCALGRIDDGVRLFDHVVQVVPVILPVDLEDAMSARRLLARIASITARDAIHAAVMRRHGIEVIYSFDRHFDAVPGIRRVEP